MSQTATLNTSLAAFPELGYVIVPGLLTREEAAELHGLVGEAHAAGTSSGRSSANERALLRDRRFLSVLVRPALLDAVRACVGDDLQLLAYASLDTAPGRGNERDWHADFRERVPATLCVNCGVYLQDMTPDVGPLHVVPGSHRRDRAPSAEEEHAALPDEVPVPLSAGDCVVFDAQLWHTGSRNASARPRRAVFAYFGRFWMKRMHAYYETPLPDEVTRAGADPLLRQLFGLESAFPSVHGEDYNARNPRWR